MKISQFNKIVAAVAGNKILLAIGAFFGLCIFGSLLLVLHYHVSSSINLIDNNDGEGIMKYYSQNPGLINTKYNTLETPLIRACNKGRLNSVRALLECGASPNLAWSTSGRSNLEGYTPLHFACTSGNQDIVVLLIKHGANINAVAKDGCTPRDIALKYDRLEILPLLQ